MPRDLITVPEIMRKLFVITDAEEGRYSDIPDWPGEVEEWTDKAALLYFPGAPVERRKIWFPLSQLRKAEDDGSVYASNWILEQKRLG